ncbi:hypothetical protein TcG_12242 [Trypanosoma cruzi]|nr:hypothetical protein TcG_12242 [Trypanosoma cruzi]
MSGRSLSFSASCGAPAVSLGKRTPLPSWHRRRLPSPLATDASGEQPCPHPSVVCRGRSQCSLDRGRMPVAKLVQQMPVKPSCSTHPLTSPPHETIGSRLPLVVDVVHTYAWSRKIAFPRRGVEQPTQSSLRPCMGHNGRYPLQSLSDAPACRETSIPHA